MLWWLMPPCGEKVKEILYGFYKCIIIDKKAYDYSVILYIIIIVEWLMIIIILHKCRLLCLVHSRLLESQVLENVNILKEFFYRDWRA